MRCGFAPLAERVKTVIGQDPLGGHLFSVELRASGVAMVLDRIDVSLLKRVPRCAGVAPLDEREALRTQIAHRDDLGSCFSSSPSGFLAKLVHGGLLSIKSNFP